MSEEGTCPQPKPEPPYWTIHGRKMVLRNGYLCDFTDEGPKPAVVVSRTEQLLEQILAELRDFKLLYAATTEGPLEVDRAHS